MTAAELRALPSEERDAILEAAAEVAAELYVAGSELMSFEANGADDLYGESPSSTMGSQHRNKSLWYSAPLTR
jgi:hypothetical protein